MDSVWSGQNEDICPSIKKPMNKSKGQVVFKKQINAKGSHSTVQYSTNMCKGQDSRFFLEINKHKVSQSISTHYLDPGVLMVIIVFLIPFLYTPLKTAL